MALVNQPITSSLDGTAVSFTLFKTGYDLSNNIFKNPVTDIQGSC